MADRVHPVLGVIDADGPVAARDDPPPAPEEIVIEAPYVPSPPRVRRILRRIALAALKRVVAKLENGYNDDS